MYDQVTEFYCECPGLMVESQLDDEIDCCFYCHKRFQFKTEEARMSANSHYKEDQNLLLESKFETKCIYRIETPEGLVLAEGTNERAVVTSAAFRWRKMLKRQAELETKKVIENAKR